MFENLKYIFARSTPKDKGYFFALERIALINNKTYYITNCTKGFLGMVARSNFDATITGNNVTIKRPNSNITTIAMEELENELIRLMKLYK